MMSSEILFKTTDFYVMKYEAKDDGSGNAISQASGTPWVSITQTNAIAECSALGGGSHLCTVNETQTINRNIEQVASNWNSSVVGTGFLFSGHNDNGPAAALAANASDNYPYSGTGDSAAACDGAYNNFVIGDDTITGRACQGQRRTLNLSNNGTIWDWSGNLWEWIYGEGASGIIGSAPAWYGVAGWIEWTNAELNDPERGKLGPSNAAWNATNSMGRYYGGASTNAFLRGGCWADGADAGSFALSLYNAPSYSNTYLGFRCCR